MFNDNFQDLAIITPISIEKRLPKQHILKIRCYNDNCIDGNDVHCIKVADVEKDFLRVLRIKG